MWDPYAEFEKETLPNGLDVYASHWPGRSWEYVCFLVHSGADQDPIGLEGVAHFVEHLISQNAEIPEKELTHFFESYGGHVNLGTTDWDATWYKFWLPADKAAVSRALSLFGNALFSETLGNSVERERRIIIGEYHRSYSLQINYDILMCERRALYPGYRYERSASALGYPESILRISQNDLQAFYDAHYAPANMSIIGVGGFTPKDLAEMLSESPFASNKPGRRTPLPVPASNIPPPLESKQVFSCSQIYGNNVRCDSGGYKTVAVVPITVAPLSIRMTKELLNYVTNDEVRENKTLTYHIGCSNINLRHFYEFAITCGHLEVHGLDEIESIIENCISSLHDRSDLFEKEKKSGLMGRFMLDITADTLCDEVRRRLAKRHRVITGAETLRNLEALTMDDVRTVLGWLTPSQRWTFLLKP